MGVISNFIPTYLKYKYIFFFISISGLIRIRIFFSAELDPDPWKKCRILIPSLRDLLPSETFPAGGQFWTAPLHYKMDQSDHRDRKTDIEQVPWTGLDPPPLKSL